MPSGTVTRASIARTTGTFRHVLQQLASSHPQHAWLPVVLPVGTETIRVVDRALARILVDAGAVEVEEEPDVEIAPATAIRGDARVGIVPLSARAPAGGSRPGRGALRLVRGAQVSIAAQQARRTLGRAGYPRREVTAWEIDRGLPGRARTGPPLLGRLVVGRRGDRSPTMLEHALSAEGVETDGVTVLIREGALVALSPARVVRLAVGPSRVLDGQRAALDSLRACGPPPHVADRVAWIESAASAGLARWTGERRLAGAQPPSLAGALLDDCLDFLAALHTLECPHGERSPFVEQADAVASVCAGEREASAVRELGAELERSLAQVGRVFGHGDFHRGNLLELNGRLNGVVDWAGAGPERLPLLDYLHLHSVERSLRTRRHLGPVIVDEVLPCARAGSDEPTRAFCRRLGLDPSHDLLERLVLAYWLDFVARDLAKSADRRERPDWVEPNVRLVARALAAGAR
jgi:phosphotransferase family enzyme